MPVARHPLKGLRLLSRACSLAAGSDASQPRPGACGLAAPWLAGGFDEKVAEDAGEHGWQPTLMGGLQKKLGKNTGSPCKILQLEPNIQPLARCGLLQGMLGQLACANVAGPIAWSTECAKPGTMQQGLSCHGMLRPKEGLWRHAAHLLQVSPWLPKGSKSPSQEAG